MSAIARTHSRTDHRRHLLMVPPAGFRSATRHPESRWAPLVIRLAVAADAASLRRLAHMDSARPLSGQALLAEQAGSVIAALSLDDGAVIADPFLPSADAVALLRLRATQFAATRVAA